MLPSPTSSGRPPSSRTNCSPASPSSNVIGLPYDLPGTPTEGRLLAGFVSLEISRVDSSFASFYGVHSGLAMGSIYYCGSDEQKQRWLPAMRTLEKIGAFGLTEPHGGSDVAGGLETTARRDGDHWILDGAKRWIGNGTFADLVVDLGARRRRRLGEGVRRREGH